MPIFLDQPPPSWVPPKPAIIRPADKIEPLAQGIFGPPPFWRADGDPYWGSVVSLLHLNGSDGSTTFTDSKGLHSWSRTGNPEIDTAQSVFGGASALFTGGNGNFVSTSDSSDFEFGSGDFTVEVRARFSSIASFCTFASKFNNDDGNQSWLFFWNQSANELRFVFSDDGSSNAGLAAYSWTPTVDTWYALAASRIGNTLHLLLDGTEVATADMTGITLFDGDAPLVLGARASAAGLTMNGWLDELRITKGVGRYGTGGYTLATEAFPDN